MCLKYVLTKLLSSLRSELSGHYVPLSMEVNVKQNLNVLDALQLKPFDCISLDATLNSNM